MDNGNGTSVRHTLLVDDDNDALRYYL